MIPADAILTGMWSHLNSHTGLRSILGATGRVIKGARRPEGLKNPCITIQMPVRVAGGWYSENSMIRTMTEPIWVSAFVDNYSNGAANVAMLSTLCANVHTIAATTRPTISGARVHRIGALDEVGPVYDQQDPHEAYMVISFGYWLSAT